VNDYRGSRDVGATGQLTCAYVIDIKLIDKNANSIFFILFNKQYIIIPVRFFSSEDEATAYFNEIKVNMHKENLSMQQNSGRHLYYWGLLGLFPLVGAFAGLVLIFQGVSRYKDKVLVIIGVADILITICIYSFLYYQVEHGEGQFKKTNIINLDVLVKDIENYKLQKGNYPDSLEQLLQIDKFAPINDVFLLRKPESIKTTFNYQKINDKYALFSSGFDKIPNTNDDIYPPFDSGGSSK